MVQVWNSKKECRSFFKSLVVQKFSQDLSQNQQHLSTHLRDFMTARTGVWGAYRALPTEAHVEEVFNISHIDWGFPKMHEGGLEFYQGRQFVPGPYGVQEPEALLAKRVDIEGLDGLLIPGLSFNKNGNRLGKGKGFYDKALQSYLGIKVGICFDFQISSQILPIEIHDVKVDYLITESGIVECRNYQE